MNMEVYSARECAPPMPIPPPAVIIVETSRTPYATTWRYRNEIDLSEYNDPRLAPLMKHLEQAPGACLEGQELYDRIDHDALISLNEQANMVKRLPTRIWAK